MFVYQIASVCFLLVCVDVSKREETEAKKIQYMKQTGKVKKTQLIGKKRQV